MSQFWQALSDGEFPVSWSNNFANYGIPLPLFAHQVPNYLGALLIGLGAGVVSAYNIVMFAGVFGSGLGVYFFLRRHVSELIAVSASIFNLLFAYRIINVYIRGALPEVVAAAVLPVILIGIEYLVADQKSKKGPALLLLGATLLALSHPMMLIIYGVPAAGYFLYSLAQQNKSVRVQAVISATLSVGAGILIATYYLLPLLFERKYFYQSLNVTEFGGDKFLGLANFIDPQWYYYFTHPGPRGHFIKVGVIELVTLCLAGALSIWQLAKQKIQPSALQLWVGISLLLIVLMLPLSQPLYQYLPGFQELQYPWRFLNALQFTIPFVAAFLIASLAKKWQSVAAVLLVGSLLVARVPQLYGKNYVEYPEEQYAFTQTNLHTQSLNPIWSGNSLEYPVKTQQAAVIEGNAQINVISQKNASRTYQVSATQSARLVDYTFYFPGWEVQVDGAPVPIEFQDPNFRGLLTYQVPAGEHIVQVSYEDTKVRLLAKALSLIGILIGLIWIIGYSKWSAMLKSVRK